MGVTPLEPHPTSDGAVVASSQGSGEPRAADATAFADTEPASLAVPLRFTGTGGEYFRIWVVNLLLSLLTLGLYSAWAKVRKASWFARNTELLGDRFEFVADPWAILRGRVLAVLLLAFYTFAFDFSLTLGYVATGVLVAVAPVLFASAMRFRLQNTRWRGIRFGFTGTRIDAYRQVLPVALLWISGTAIGAAMGEAALGVAAIVTVLLVPWMHHRIKAFQHRRATFANLQAGFRPALGRFYAIYVLGGLILLGAGLVAALVVGALTAVVVIGARGGSGTAPAWLPPLAFAAGGAFMLFVYIVAWPYFATRIQRAVWERSTLGPHAFRTDVRFGPAARIALRYGLLLPLTAGLAWPFAVVAWTRYRVGAMALLPGTASLDDALAAVDSGGSGRAVGEGAADFFGIDFGW